MKFTSKVSSFILTAAIALTLGAINTSAELLDDGTPTTIIEESNYDCCEQIHVNDLHTVSATSSCNHNGTEKTVTFVGKCYCGSFLYQVNCKACGGFVGALCTNPNCTYWS